MILNHDARERKLAKGDAGMEMPSKLGFVAKIRRSPFLGSSASIVSKP